MSDPLQAAAVAAHLPSTRRRFTVAGSRIHRHLRVAAARGWVSWSGGKDSTAVVDLARRVDATIPVVFYDSGLEFPENLTYMRDLAQAWSLNFHTIEPTDDPLDLFAATGAWDHQARSRPSADLHDTLITKPSQQALERYGPANLWGLRAEESNARRALLAPGDGTFTRKDATTVTSPIWDFNDRDVWAYHAANSIPLNPVYRRLIDLGAQPRDLRVGLVFDANNLNNGRITWLRLGWPDLYARLVDRLPRLAEYR